MADSLFDIFGDRHQQAVRNISRQPLDNIRNENLGKLLPGKSVPTNQGKPIKPTEPVKSKKTFLVNSGLAIQSTPAREMYSPLVRNVAPVIYTDHSAEDPGYNSDEFEFTKPTRKYDYCELFDFTPKFMVDASPPSTPPPNITKSRMDIDNSFIYQDDFFRDVDNYSLSDEELELPPLY